MLNKIGAFYKDNDPEVYAKTYYNDVTGMYEVHFYDNTIKEEPPVALCTLYKDAVTCAEEWVS